MDHTMIVKIFFLIVLSLIAIFYAIAMRICNTIVFQTKLSQKKEIIFRKNKFRPYIF